MDRSWWKSTQKALTTEERSDCKLRSRGSCDLNCTVTSQVNQSSDVCKVDFAFRMEIRCKGIGVTACILYKPPPFLAAN